MKLNALEPTFDILNRIKKTFDMEEKPKIADLQTHQEELDYLKSLGFPINPINDNAGSLKEIWQKVEKLEHEKNDLAYPVDGLVVKLNDLELVEKLGIIGKTPRGWSAIKFKTEEVTTKLQNVVWQIGRTGKFTPVVELEPVDLGGTIVKRATLHNFKEFSDLGLVPGDVLVIRKAGEIIPEVVSVLFNLRPKNELFEPPTICPSCGTKLEKTKTEIDLICPNSSSCKDQVLGKLIYYCQRNLGNITGLSDKILEKFYDLFEIRDIPDLYDLPFDEIQKLEGFGQKSVANLQESVEKAKSIDAYRFLAGLGIDGIGPEIAKLILENTNLESEN